MSVIAAALRELMAAGLTGDELVAAVARIEAEMAISPPIARSSDAVERKREADRERLRRKREAARAENGRADDREKSQVSHEVADCRATSATSRDECDPSPEEKRKVSPCTPSKEKTQPSPNFTPSVPNGTSSPSATDCDATDRQDELAEALTVFNRMAAEVGLPEAQGLSRKRRLALKARLQDCGGIAGWRIAMDRVRSSPFLRGDNDRGWRASLDFLLKPESFAKMMEGAYDPAPGAQRRRTEPRSSMVTAAAEVLIDHPDSEFGKRARAAGFRSGDLRGGDAILAGMARVAEHRFGQRTESTHGPVIDGAADELFRDYADV
ncbi:hypothetical protein [Xanthobacter sp. 91]|uniref:hypothetical protein n=1 Tax=Xanthobacter sp. 91 TaxID=1117244 RepID=UPI00068EED76|nr:hypothetical protein [Xanthobacter sp. 91]